VLLWRKRIGPTALTWAKPGTLRGISILKETHVLTQRMARATGWTAKNTGSLHGEDKLTVGRSVTIKHRLPAFIISG
jgi:hypothetical protein